MNHDDATLGWINTYTGRKFYPLAPDENEFDMRDQVHAIANTARYNGHTRRFYSVAEHALLLSHLVEGVLPGRLILSSEAVVDAALWALLHDNHEAYIGDIVRPLKRLPAFAFLGELEARYGRLVREWQGLVVTDALLAEIGSLDVEMVRYESAVLFGDLTHPDWELPKQTLTARQAKVVRSGIMCLEPEAAKLAYQARFLSLSRTRLR